MNFGQLIANLRERRQFVMAFGVLGFVLAGLAALLIPRDYRAQAEMLLAVRDPTSLLAINDPQITQQLQPDYMTTQVDVANSDRVAAKVVDNLKILADPEAMNKFRQSGSKQDARAYFTDQIKTGLKVLPTENSRVINFIYRSPNPETAAVFANAFGDAFRDVNIELQREPEQQSAEANQKAIDDLGTQLAQAEADLAAQRRRLGVSSTQPGVPDAEETRLVALSQQLAAAEATEASERTRPSNGAVTDVLSNPVIQGLQSQIAQVEAQRAQLATFAGPNNVDYQQLSHQLDTLRGELARQKGLVTQSAHSIAGRSGASVAQLRAQVAAQRQRVIASEGTKGQLSGLEQKVATLKASYQALTERQTQSSLRGASSQTNVLRLSRATPPSSPSGLPLPLQLALGLTLGLLTGMAIIVTRELLRPRMRVPDDSVRLLGVPSLGGVRAISAPDRPQALLVARRFLPGPSQGDNA